MYILLNNNLIIRFIIVIYKYNDLSKRHFSSLLALPLSITSTLWVCLEGKKKKTQGCDEPFLASVLSRTARQNTTLESRGKRREKLAGDVTEMSAYVSTLSATSQQNTNEMSRKRRYFPLFTLHWHCEFGVQIRTMNKSEAGNMWCQHERLLRRWEPCVHFWSKLLCRKHHVRSTINIFQV